MELSDADIWRRAVNTWRTASDELSRLHGTIDREVFIRCVRMIGECRGRIVTSGAGTSGSAAKKVAHTLSCIERPAFFLSPSDAVHGALGSVQHGDIAILFSKGGGTHEILEMIPALKSKHVKLIGVTENIESALAADSDVALVVRVKHEADRFNMLATTSTVAVLAVFDALCVVLMDLLSFCREQFAIIHPGGAVGARLLEGRE